jgi:hypothetical protein
VHAFVAESATTIEPEDLSGLAHSPACHPLPTSCNSNTSSPLLNRVPSPMAVWPLHQPFASVVSQYQPCAPVPFTPSTSDTVTSATTSIVEGTPVVHHRIHRGAILDVQELVGRQERILPSSLNGRVGTLSNEKRHRAGKIL